MLCAGFMAGGSAPDGSFGCTSVRTAWMIMRSALENCGWHVVSVIRPSMPGSTFVERLPGMGLTTSMSPGSVISRPLTCA